MNELIRLEECYEQYKKDPEFQRELQTLLDEYAGRPSLLYYAEKMTRDLGGAKTVSASTVFISTSTVCVPLFNFYSLFGKVFPVRKSPFIKYISVQIT